MPNLFKSVIQNVGVTKQATMITVPASTTITVIGLSIANVIGGNTSITADVILTRLAVDYYIIKGAPILPGDTLVVVGGDQKLVAQTGDTIRVVTSTASAADVVLSYLEIT